jgi:hypothetical protein
MVQHRWQLFANTVAAPDSMIVLQVERVRHTKGQPDFVRFFTLWSICRLGYF